MWFRTQMPMSESPRRDIDHLGTDGMSVMGRNQCRIWVES